MMTTARRTGREPTSGLPEKQQHVPPRTGGPISLDVSRTVGVVSAKGWVVIPKEFRERHGFKKGTRVAFVELDGVVSIVPLPDDPVAGLLGILKAPDGVDITQELIEDHRREVEAEEAAEAEFHRREPAP